jgi:hypothetical protein
MPSSQPKILPFLKTREISVSVKLYEGLFLFFMITATESGNVSGEFTFRRILR